MVKAKSVWRPLEELSDLIFFEPKTGRVDYRELVKHISDSYQEQYEQGFIQSLYDQCIDSSQEEMNERLFQTYQIITSDISDPGSWPIIAHDLIDHLFARHEGELRENRLINLARDRGDLDPVLPDDRDRQQIGADIRNFVAEGKLREAIDLMATLEDVLDQNTIILLQGRFARLQRDSINGIIDRSYENVERAKIANTILNLVNNIE